MKTKSNILHKVWAVLDQYWLDLGSPLSLKLAQLRKEENYSMIVKIIGSINNEKLAQSPLRLRRTRWAVDILKKATYLPSGIDVKRSAVVSWANAEYLCRRTNLLFENLSCNSMPSNKEFHARMEVLYKWAPKVRRIVRKLMGEVPSVEDVFGGFGPGATLSNSRRESDVLTKLSATPTLTSGARWFIPALPRRLMACWGEEEQWHIVDAGRLHLVPKSYKTERPIMVEPLVNASIQRYFGDYLRRRLLYAGIDLSKDSKKHEQLACEGSVLRNWATIDLSSASDTIAREAVRYLVDPYWFRVLDASRTPRIEIPMYDEYKEDFQNYGVMYPIHTLEKFSSMGNGFTFELETIIFLAICTAVCTRKGVGGVYGDDMIVGTSYYAELRTVLEAFGFVLNADKSYHTGFFRESCGGDYARGVYVKGVTLKEEPNCVTEWYDLHNRIWEQNEIVGLFGRTLNIIRKMVPKDKRLNIPYYLGSGGFFSHELKPRVQNSIHYYKCYVPVTKYKKEWQDLYPPEVQLAAGLLGGVPTNNKGRLIGPAKFCSVPSCKLAWVPCS